ncbi:glycosyltransferase family 87 protein [Salinibacterium sp. G-O1]|uniref:glycosyltransferase family 87 protein n=1 Tax=Salinibacterium sp. G-O1 TaxID=3046208 RepID=UPI0024B9FA38|nr:glycosyltransferase family 87 protein [Salinibacterium sp. G-O1]MDJ0334609.1 glycosyltransferase family 87 protein [Salinibacterium sp. G-O1]
MTESTPRLRGVDRLLGSRPAAWAGFIVVHAWLAWLCLFGRHEGMNDVSSVYRQWVEQALDTGVIVGIDSAWVYPILAIVPMLAAAAFGTAHYVATWVALVVAVNALAFAVIATGTRVRVAWWWLAFLVALGPIALARIDAITVSLGVVGVLMLSTRPRLAGVVLAVATWVKVWPAVLIAAAVVTSRSRWRIVLAGAVVSAGVVILALILGGGARILSFVTEQAGRGLQIEAPITTFWMWAAFTGQPGASVYFDHEIITYQVTGAGVDVAAAAMTPLLVVVVAVVLALGVRAVRAGATMAQVLPSLSLSLVVALIAVNKVGSPQFIGWIAVPIVLGLAMAGGSFRTPAFIALGIAALTQVIYPYLYFDLVTLQPGMLLALTLRNILEFVLLGWAIRALVLSPSRRPLATL